MVLMNSKMVALGTAAIDFSLPATDGNRYTLDSFSEKEILVIIFMCNHCPYVKALFGRLNAIQNDYADRGVQVIGINPNDEISYPEDSLKNMKKVVAEKAIPYIYLRDENQETARKYDAVCTPDIYVYGRERKLLYRGRIDDNWQDETGATRQDLREALDAILDGRPVTEEQIPSMGCSIKWK